MHKGADAAKWVIAGKPLLRNCRRRVSKKGKEKGGPPTPKRPAIAFLVTPKLPLGGRKVKFDEADVRVDAGSVNHSFDEIFGAPF